MNESEVIAGRAYTGPLYVKMNGSLRKASKKFAEQEHLNGNLYTNLINSFLRKASQMSIIPPNRKVYRVGSKMSYCQYASKCVRRGADAAALISASSPQAQTRRWRRASSATMPVIFEFDVGDIDRGASLSFLS
jgi:hypothetical protein